MNNKGFTLIELLASIVIIALLSGIAIFFSSAFYKTSDEKYYNSLESNILLAGNDYFADHRDELPIGNTYSEVPLASLIDKKYIEPVTDTKGNECREGSVYAYREDNILKYEVCLVGCGEYSSSGRYCNENISREITASAKTKNTKASYDVTKSYNSAAYAKNENVLVTFDMADEFNITKYVIRNTKDDSEIVCNTTSGNTCVAEINKSGTYKVESYDGNDTISSKYINVKIARNGSNFSLDTSDGARKYLISQNECSKNSKTKNVTINIIKGTPTEEYKSVEYRVNGGTYTSINNLSFKLNLESGHYDIEVVITNYNDDISVETIGIDVSYLLNIEYDDGTTATHEVVNGQVYNYLSSLPKTKLSHGLDLNVSWYKDNTKINPDVDFVNNNCTFTIVGQTVIPVNVEDFTKYCNSGLAYTGAEQVLTKAAPSNVTFINNKGTNAGNYTVKAHIETQYIWSDGTRDDKEFTCTINKVVATISCSDKNYTGSAQTGCTCSGGTIGGTNSATNAGTYTVSCTGDSNHTNPANKDWKINKVASSITCANRNYTGSAQNMYSASSGCTPSTNKTATNAGTYTVSCTGDANHNNSSCSATMNKVAATISCSNKTYNGSAQTGCTCSGGTIGGTPTATNAGTYNVSCTGDGNHTNPSNSSWTMNKASSSITCANKTYNGSAQNMYSASSGCTPSTNKTATNAGTYTVSCTGDANHNNSSCSATMNKVAATISCSNKTYNGSAQTGCTCSGGTIGGTPTATNAGTYNVSCTGDGNHTNPSNSSWTMNKASSSITCANKTYNGSAQNMYSASSGCTPSTNKTATNAGTYTVSCTGDANHNNSSCSATMNKASSSITCANRNYTGSAQNMYSASSGCTPSTNKTATNAGTYTVSCTGDANHNNSSCSATMNKVAATINCSNKTYSGGAQTGCTCSGGTIGGTYSATNTGEYTASCTADSNHTNPSNKKWTITQNCGAGKYLPANSQTCAVCPNGYYCTGISGKITSSSNQGLTSCPSGYPNSDGARSANGNCYKDSSEERCVGHSRLNECDSTTPYVSGQWYYAAWIPDYYKPSQTDPGWKCLESVSVCKNGTNLNRGDRCIQYSHTNCRNWDYTWALAPNGDLTTGLTHCDCRRVVATQVVACKVYYNTTACV